MSLNKADAAIIDCYVQSLELLLKGRNAEMIPVRALRARADFGNFAKASDYYAELLSQWRYKPSQPLIVDLLCVNDRQAYMIERWTFWYNRDESKDPRPLPNRKVQTFIRSLFSFVRLLPGYQLPAIKRDPYLSMYFDVYHTDMHPMTPFSITSPIEYKFPVVTGTGSKSSLNVAVSYLPPASLQWVLSIAEHVPAFAPRNNRSEKPIPSEPIPINKGGAAGGGGGGVDSDKGLRSMEEINRAGGGGGGGGGQMLDFQPSIHGAADHHQSSFSLDSAANHRRHSGAGAAAAGAGAGVGEGDMMYTDPRTAKMYGGGAASDRQRSISSDMIPTSSNNDLGAGHRSQAKSLGNPEDYQLPPAGKHLPTRRPMSATHSLGSGSGPISPSNITRPFDPLADFQPGGGSSHSAHSSHHSSMAESGSSVGSGGAGSYKEGSKISTMSYSPHVEPAAFATDIAMNGPLSSHHHHPGSGGGSLGMGMTPPEDGGVGGVGVSPPFANAPTYLMSTSPPVGGRSLSQMRDVLRKPGEKGSSWRGPSPTLATVPEGECDANCTEDMQKFALKPSPFESVVKALNAFNIPNSATEAAAQQAAAAAAAEQQQQNQAQAATPGTYTILLAGGPPAPPPGTTPSSLSILAQQFGTQPVSSAATQQQLAAFNGAAGGGIGQQADDDDNESNSSNESDCDLEDMPFAVDLESVNISECVVAPGEETGHYRDSTIACVPLGNTLQQLCFAPPQLISFKSSSESSSSLKQAGGAPGTAIATKLSEFIAYREALGPRFTPAAAAATVTATGAAAGNVPVPM